MRITVSDNGPGVATGTERLIFRDGFTTNTSESGRPRGLGLALVDRLVTQLGGSTEVSQGPGAEFTVRLPTGSGPGRVASPVPARPEGGAS